MILSVPDNLDQRSGIISRSIEIGEETKIANKTYQNNNSILCKNIVTNFFSVIKIIDGENEETYYPDAHNVSMMRYELVKALSKKWLEMTSGK